MIVTATEFKNRVGKYLEFTNNGEEVVISKNGKQIAKLIPVSQPKAPNVNGLVSLLQNASKDTKSISKADIREERLKDYENLT